MRDAGKIERLLERGRQDLEREAAEVLQRFPLQPYLDSIRRCPDYDGVASLLRERAEAIERGYDERTRLLYQKLALLMLIRGSLERIGQEGFPAGIRDLCLDRFRKILEGLPLREAGACSHRNAAFVDDVRWCSLGTLPVGGAWMIEVSAVWKKNLTGGGIRQFLSFLLFILFKLGGRGPVYRIHTLKRYAGGFTPGERTNCYLGVAELLKQNEDIKGVYLLGWLYDPKLADVSPELAYLRELPERNGARLYRFGKTETGVRLATAFSPKRKKLHEEGKYTPTDYALIWPRKEMLAWAARQTNQKGSAA